MRDAPFLNLVLAVALTLMTGWLLVVGQAIVLPIVMAVIAVYVLTTASEVMGRQPVLGRLPGYVRHLVVLLVFTAALVGFALVIQVTFTQLMSALPRYQANLEVLIERLADYGWIEDNQTLDEIVAVTLERVNLQSLFLRLFSGLTSFSMNVFLVALYAAFLLGERRNFSQKLAAALPAGNQAEVTSQIVEQINTRIGDYLAAKTLVNVILAAVSYAILWWMDVDFALFWALLIGLFNYIPYLGGPFGVAPPVILSLAQWGDPWSTIVLCGLLAFVQTVIGTILDPKLVGRQVNLSPFVVMAALAIWGALWGLPGAILAVPMTSIIAIVCSAFKPTQFVSVLLADKVEQEAGTFSMNAGSIEGAEPLAMHATGRAGPTGPESSSPPR
ncbi:MAG: AI-2E family transporter [Rhizobiaceae bacterium]|nr:AI-2E family transporter [Rhizobiaceae bacterium]